MYYDSANQIYITVDSDGKATTDSTQQQATTSKSEECKKPQNEDKNDKVKMAKKIAKDMEKWAKTLNQKKESTRATNILTETNIESDEPSTADAAYYLLEKQISNPQEYPTEINKATTGSDPFEIIKAEEERLIDRNRLACLLCKRQFNSSDLLNKHQEFSELHKVSLLNCIIRYLLF